MNNPMTFLDALGVVFILLGLGVILAVLLDRLCKWNADDRRRNENRGDENR